MKNPPFEDVFAIENMDFPASHVTFREGISICATALWLWEIHLPVL